MNDSNVREHSAVYLTVLRISLVASTRELLQLEVADPQMDVAKPHHLLWALMFMKMYADESEMAALCGGDGNAVDKKTFRKWTNLFIERISYLVFDIIVWDNRKKGDILNDCLVSIDGTDCSILWQPGEPKSWSSHKFGKKPGVCYELGVCILTGDNVWVMGPFACGDWPDINCFRWGVENLLEQGERVEADDGYIGEDPLTVKAL